MRSFDRRHPASPKHNRWPASYRAALAAVVTVLGVFGAVPPSSGSHDAMAATAGDADAGRGYESLAILQPRDQATVHYDGSPVTVAVAVKPRLRAGAGDRLMLMVDGAAMAPQTDTRFQLPGLVRGAHTLQATVVDPDGQQLILSAPVNFYLWQGSRLFPSRTKAH